MDLRVGDRVQFVKQFDSNKTMPDGMWGTVTDLPPNDHPWSYLKVKWDNGHPAIYNVRSALRVQYVIRENPFP